MNNNGVEEGFIYRNGTYTTIDPAGPTNETSLTGINASGQVIGFYYNNDGVQQGFIYSNGTYTTIDPAGPTVVTVVTGINNSGQVVGYYINNDGVEEGFVASPVPTVEPDRAHVQVAGTVTANAASGVLANDTDPIPNDTLTVSAVDGQASNVDHAVAGSYGTLTLNADGSYSYVANHNVPSNIIAQDDFTYTASDGAGGSATSSLTITVSHAGWSNLHSGHAWSRTFIWKRLRVSRWEPFAGQDHHCWERQ
jgi:probable HAF family extracellular repeat protein/VCBS repeat-containing protein